MGSVFVRSRPLSKNMHGKCWMHATMLEVRTIPKMQIPSFLASLIFFRIHHSWNKWEQLQPESLYATSNQLRNLSRDTVGFDLCVHHIGHGQESQRQDGWMTQQPQLHGLAHPMIWSAPPAAKELESWTLAKFRSPRRFPQDYHYPGGWEPGLEKSHILHICHMIVCKRTSFIEFLND